MAKPRISEKRQHGGPFGTERIMEFGHGSRGTGGLLALRTLDDDRLRLDLYRMSGPVEVVVSLPRDISGETVTGEVFFAPKMGVSLRLSVMAEMVSLVRRLAARGVVDGQHAAQIPRGVLEEAKDLLRRVEVR